MTEIKVSVDFGYHAISNASMKRLAFSMAVHLTVSVVCK